MEEAMEQMIDDVVSNLSIPSALRAADKINQTMSFSSRGHTLLATYAGSILHRRLFVILNVTKWNEGSHPIKKLHGPDPSRCSG